MLKNFFSKESNSIFKIYVIPYDKQNLSNNLLLLFLKTKLPVVLKLNRTPIIVESKDANE